jgi:hypothetical protein
MAEVTVADRQAISSSMNAALAQAAQQAAMTPNLTKAYVKAWGTIGNVKKDANNPHHKNDYATLEATLAVIKPVLIANDLALLQSPGEVDERGNQRVVSILMHGPSAERWTFISSIPLGDKKTAQASGSCLTYARRYFLQAFFGMAPVDDDGEEASDDVPETDHAYTSKGPAAVMKLIDDFTADDGETGKAAAKRFSAELKEKASETGDKKVVEKYLAKYKELKAGVANSDG